MKRAMSLFVLMAVLGTVGVPMTLLAGESAPEPIWSTDTVPPAPPKKAPAQAPKVEPYSGPVWSTDSAMSAKPEKMPAPAPAAKPYTGPMVAPPALSLDPSYSGPVWSTDTVAPAPPKEVKAPAPKMKPSSEPIWSTDSNN
jgi:hypothetical protein